jgi:hypothetical protein
VSDPITSFDDIEPGEIVMVAEYVEPHGKEAFWWRSFRVVVNVYITSNYANTLVLRMDINPDKDLRTIELGDKCVVTRIDPDKIPAGVSAMYMKALAKRIIVFPE